jgi:hypothetical protein
LDLLTHLGEDRVPALALFDHAKQLAALVEVLGIGRLPATTAPAPKEAS